MSRFHCRFYFKPGEGLWAEDLGSANQTLVNDKPLFDSRLQVDDRLTIGDTTLKVLHDEMPAAAGKPAPPAGKPAQLADKPASLADKPAPPADKPVPAADDSELDITRPIDNLFESPEKPKPPGPIQFLRPPASPSDRQRRIAVLRVVLIAVAAVAGIALLISRFQQRPAPAGKPPETAADTTLEIAYEKIQANSKNIFRYQMALQNDKLSIQIDDLNNRRHVPGNQAKPVDAEELKSLTNTLAGFFDLKDEYKGLATDVWDIYDLTITLGRKTRRVRVLNSIEPDAFKKTRQAIDDFGQAKLGLTALAMSPEKLLELAKQAVLLGQNLYDQRNVKNDNLALAIRSLKEAEWYLETIEPKPDFYAEGVALRAKSEGELDEIYKNHLFQADRARTLNDWAEAANQYRLICERIPDRSDARHEAARKKLLEVERNIKKK
jgi:hypothetical protein